MKKGEIAHFEQFHIFFPQSFPNAFFFNVLKWVCMEETIKVPIAVFVYKIQVNPIRTILKYGIYYDFMDRL